MKEETFTLHDYQYYELWLVLKMTRMEKSRINLSDIAIIIKEVFGKEEVNFIKKMLD